MKKILLMLVLLVFNSMPVFAIMEDMKVKDGETLYLIDCIKIALTNSPKVHKAYQDILIAKSDIGGAKSDYFPTIGAGIDYESEHKSNPNYDDCSTKGHRPEYSVYLQQAIFNFGKTIAKIDMSKFRKIAAEYTYKDVICHTINDVKVKYMNLLHAKSYVEIEKANLKIAQAMLDLTKKMYEQGQKEETDYTSAQVYLSDAQISLEKAINIYKKAKSDLCNSMYIYDNAGDFKVRYIDTFNYYDAYFNSDFLEVSEEQRATSDIRPQREIINGKIHSLPFGLDEAQEYARQNSHDLKAMAAIVKAMEKNALIAKRQYYPSLTARVGYNYDNKYRLHKEDHYVSAHQLSYMVGLTAQVNGMKVITDVERAKAQIEQTEESYLQLKNDIYYNVERAYYDVETAEKQISNSSDKIDKAIKDLNLTYKQYVSNKASALDFQQARVRYNESKLQYIASLRDYNTALAELEKETHRHSKEVLEFASSLAPSIVNKKK